MLPNERQKGSRSALAGWDGRVESNWEGEGGRRENLFELYHMRIKSIFYKRKKSQKQCGKAGKYLMLDCLIQILLRAKASPLKWPMQT